MLTEEMKLEAVVVTVVRADEHELLRALARKVHITALQVNSRPPHSSRRGMCSCHGESGKHLLLLQYSAAINI